jgi:hypothetical protein
MSVTIPTPIKRKRYFTITKTVKSGAKYLSVLVLVVIPIGILCWLFFSIEITISVNDRQTIVDRTLALAGEPLHVHSVQKVPESYHSKVVEKSSDPVVNSADQAALKHGIDPMLFRALITQESKWDPKAVSPVGAAGLTQLMPNTAADECGLTAEERFEVEKNLNCGAYYFAKQLERFGAVDLALAAYNSGPDRVAKLGRVPRIRETEDYVSRIMTNWNRGV